MAYRPAIQKSYCSILIGFVLVLSFVSQTYCQSEYLIKTGTTPKDSGFKMKDWFVWGGSVIKVDDAYHLFASRWPKSTQFPEGYMTHSEIVRATADNPLGPYTFQEVVLGKRDSKYWDAIMTHNPSIYKTGDAYVLYYNARGNAPYRQIGYAASKDITGPWLRSDKPIDFGCDANNPAALFEPDGSVKLMWRDRKLGIYLAAAPSYKGPYTVVNHNVWPPCKLEDFYLFKYDGLYHMICEDNRGGVSGHERWGVHFTSNDGVYDWRPSEPIIFYNHNITWDDDTGIHCERRERPQLLIGEFGKITHLFTSVLYKGEAWNQAVPISLERKVSQSTNKKPLIAEPDEKIVFKKMNDVELKLHIFKPENHQPSDKRPAIVFFFGGGWKGGSPSQFYQHSRYFSERGMAAICAEYRVERTHGTKPYECVKDGKSAIRYVRAHADDLGIDPNRIAAGGGSAGGHVAAACGMLKTFNDPQDDPFVSAKPNALVLFNPVYDNSEEGYGYERVEEHWREFSPMHNIDKSTPPAIVFLGTKDKLIPVSTAWKFKELMEKAGVRSELRLYEGQPHGFFNYLSGKNPYYDKTLIEADKFLASLGYLKGAPTLQQE